MQGVDRAIAARVAGALGCWLGLVGPGFAAEVPRFDVEAHCEKIASFGGSYSAVLDEACFAQEQQAYDRLKPMWPQLPAEMAAHCEKIASFGGPGSYTLMEACVQQEMQASGGKAGRTFKF